MNPQKAGSGPLSCYTCYMALVSLTGIPPTLPPVHSRSFYATVNQTRNIWRRYPRYHVPKPHSPTPSENDYWKETHAAWRRHWQEITMQLWGADNTGKGKAWWNAQAALVQVLSNQGELKYLPGKQFFDWYQLRVIDSLLTNYIPFPAGLATLPAYYEDPWAPPDLGTPYLVSTSAPAIVTLAYPYDSTLALLVLPIALFALNPPVLETHPRNTIAWTPFDSTPTDDWAEHSYDLSDIFPHVTKGSRGTVLACYGVMPNPILHQGPNTPAQAVTDYSGEMRWNSAYQSRILDYAVATCGGGGLNPPADYLVCSDLGFSIPSDATITGVKLSYYRCAAEPLENIVDDSIYLVVDGIKEGINHADTETLWPKQTYSPPYGLEWAEYGGQSDNWGATLTPAKVNANDFGAALKTREATGSDYAGARVDATEVTVYYSPAGPTEGAQFTMPTQIPFSLP